MEPPVDELARPIAGVAGDILHHFRIYLAARDQVGGDQACVRTGQRSARVEPHRFRNRAEVSDPLAHRPCWLPPEETPRVPEVFGADLLYEPAFTGQVLADLRDLLRHGAAAVIRRETTT